MESLSDEPDPEEQEEVGETAPLTKTNEEDYEFVIQDDEAGGPQRAPLLRSMSM